MPAASPPSVLRFERFEIRSDERVLRVDGATVPIGARAFDLLVALAERRDRLVGKQELLDVVWPGVVVEEHNITTQISTLRKLLGPQAITTVPGRGYRLTASPEEGASAVPGPVAPSAQPVQAFAVSQSRLPHELTPLVGRDDDLAGLTALLQRHRLVTLTGAGGTGKSLLAQHVLRREAGAYAQGVCWVELASVTDAAALPARIAEALGAHLGSGDPLASLCAAIAPMNVLLALDNAEHLANDVAHAAGALHDAAPAMRLLVTSQVPLRLAAERVVRLGPLAVPEGPLPAALAQTFGAIALFVERARGADAHFAWNDAAAPAVIDVCRQLDGLPLAIELAAARAPLLGAAGLAASMHEALKVLTRNRDIAAPARQQTLRAALAWSHDLLDARARVVFRRLGVMAGSASLGFIQEVVAEPDEGLDGWAVLDVLGELVDRSLVTVLADGADDGGEAIEPRYRLLESPRLFALEQLAAAGEETALRRRHAARLGARFDAAWAVRWSGDVGARRWAERIVLDASNARAAIAWARSQGDADTVVTLAATLFQALPRTPYLERLAMADLCETLAGAVAVPRLRLRALETAVRPLFHPDQQRSLEIAGQALRLARELDRVEPDRWLLYRALGLWIEAASVVAVPDVGALHVALAELDSLEDPHWPPHKTARGAEARRLSRVVLGGAGQALDQLQLTRRAAALLEAEGADTTPLMGTLVDAELECGNTQAAIALGNRVLAQLEHSRDEWSRMLVRSNLALAWLGENDPVRARALMQAVWPQALLSGLHTLCADTLTLLAALEGRPHNAARLAGYADAGYTRRTLVRHPLEAAARERALSLVRAALAGAEFDRLYDEGQSLHDAEVVRLAFSMEDSG